MIRRMTFKRIALTVLLLTLFLILYNYPTEINNIETVTSNKIPIYLIDENNFVARSSINDNTLDIIDRIKEIVLSLTIDSGISLDKGFSPIIPKDTKINNIVINNGLLKIDFSHHLLNVEMDKENTMIEAIIYSLTELDEIDKIMIFVDGKRLDRLPKSNKKLDLYLDRSYGINKVIDISSIKDVEMVTVYYLAKNEDYYYVPVTFVSNSKDSKINIIIKNLKSNVLNNSNLCTHLNYQVELMDYEINDNEIVLNFNNVLLNSIRNDKLEEEVKYAISYSIRDSMSIDNVTFLIDSVFVDVFKK